MNYRISTFLCIFLLLASFTVEKKDVITIFMIGDSTMANKSQAKGNTERGWGQMLPEFLTSDIMVDNHAADGRSSLSFINEGRWKKVLSKIRKGDYVFIQFGHNDEKPAADLYTKPGGSFDDNLRRFVRETKAKGGHPILFNSIVRRNFPPEGMKEHRGRYEKEGNTLIDTHGEYLDSPHRVAKEMQVPFIDLNKLTHDLVTGMGVEQSKQLFMWVPAGKYEFCPKGKIDNTHLNIKGGRIVAGIAIGAVVKTVPELTPYVRLDKIGKSATPSPVIHNGVPWFDNRGQIVNAHGACIVEDNGKYYMFGEYKSDKSNAFPGFSCYSSDDLVNWNFERVALPMQPGGILGPNRVGERVKVMKCPSTGEYVMYMHADDLGYNDPYIGYATCSTINGEYKLQGPLLYNGNPIKRWDMGTFQDVDGKGYLLIHHGDIYRLSDNYCSIETKVAEHIPGSGESPAMFRKDEIYYLLYSNLTSWEKNDNYYFTAPKIEGPWTKQGLFTPEGSLTYNSQTTFVFPLAHGKDIIPIFMGDRWSYPHQASAATYVWLPMQVDGTKLSIPEYWSCWDINTLKRVPSLTGSKPISQRKIKFTPENGWITKNGQLVSNTQGSKLYAPFEGSRVAITGVTNCHGGYARVSIHNKDNEEVYSSLVDFYSKVEDRAMRFISPCLEKGKYTLIIEVTGIQPVWYDKKKNRFGSDDYYVIIDSIATF